MQLKWLEDFIVLAQERSYTRAAELRHVTHPAFGRRIRALEAWAGTPLVEPGSGPVRLTAAGQVFLDTAEQMARNLAQSHEELRAVAGRQARTVTLTTGRTLARTVVADLLVRLRPVMKDCELCILTRALADTVALLERGEADFSIAYHHPALAIRLDARQFSHITLASDRLVPVSRATAQGAALHPLAGAGPIPYLAYARTLALGRLVEDQLAHHPVTQRLQRTVECDSADAQYEYVHKGLGVAWLPWSMVHADCKAGRLAKAGDRSMEAKFDVRLYRPKRRLSTQAEAIWHAIATR
ncbi:LysR family transcriptional regulator [Acidovorax sp. SUPP950]|uniref:LysR family transcriptional regulator n=1 Tax=unclassified Acidovorax TaxID=2684926 RepID=UPI0023491ECE|nr:MULTISPECIES: LysR substrate-binding domain-containing protein [Comamonadaceae]WCM88582.1 LysR substrate-binding domain-containing protein [Acidovorax sp. NCPPB 3576]WCM97999.1 LysR substrate-binding domain-containing protein [Acidovorax sp. GBBC 1281]WOI47932.1 LysR substrate-binding domain-containing protein [Paracidovorax avenae]GKS76446.1 LysR family transcriptional regulator [Acidovorax sp. SUPP950]GKT17485.1 LysR family transcriptional regulator [Acidovorax sp. SUPP2522]